MANASTRQKNVSGRRAKWLRARLAQERRSINNPQSVNDARVVGGALAHLKHDPHELLPSEILPLLP
jgi:hypothetical protein